MATEIVTFNELSSWSLAAGAAISASGIKHAPLQTIGSLTGTSSANGSFSDVQGYGHLDYYDSKLYVYDSGNNRIQRFVKTSGVWTYDSKLDSVTTLLGGGATNYGLLSIDRSRGQIHVANGDHVNTSGAWISVWNLSDFPTLTVGNRVRQYGNNSTSVDAADRALLGISLTVDDTYAIVTSVLSPYRLVRWNHVTGVFSNSSTKGNTASQFVSDGSGNWYAGSQFGSDIVGLRKVDTTNFSSVLRYDTASVSQLRAGLLSFASAGVRPLYHDGRVYGRDHIGRVSAWAVAGTFLDDYLSPGGLGASNTLTGAHSPVHDISSVIYRGKGAVIVSGDTVDYIQWAHNANGSANQSFLAVYPLAVSTSEVTYTITEETATLQQLILSGINLSSEKCRVSWKKNAGSYHTLTLDKASKASEIASLGDHTFVADDTVTFKIEMSTWDRLDGHATLTATRDKLPPTDVRLYAAFDTSGDLIVNVPIPSFTARMTQTPSYLAFIDGEI